MIDSSNEQSYCFSVNELSAPELWQKIRNLTKNFPTKPYTLPGEQVYQSILNEKILPLFQNYPPLSSLLSALIYLYEIEAGARLSQSDFFQNQENQLVLIKVFGYYAERELKEENFNQYQKFFNALEKELKILEASIKTVEKPLPNILGSLTIALKEAVHTIPGSSSDTIKSEGIRNLLAKQTNFNQQYKTFFENFQNALALKSSY